MTNQDQLSKVVAAFEQWRETRVFRICCYQHMQKNWLLNNTHKGAEASAALYSLVETALCRMRHNEEFLLWVAMLTTRNILLNLNKIFN